MDAIALLIAATLNGGTVLALAGIERVHGFVLPKTRLFWHDHESKPNFAGYHLNPKYNLAKTSSVSLVHYALPLIIKSKPFQSRVPNKSYEHQTL